MRDRYNLNTLPGGSEHELAEFGKRTADMLDIYFLNNSFTLGQRILYSVICTKYNFPVVFTLMGQ